MKRTIKTYPCGCKEERIQADFWAPLAFCEEHEPPDYADDDTSDDAPAADL